MKTAIVFLLLLPLAELRPSFDALVEAERSFARTSIAKGTKEAFVGALADDAVLFRPRAVPGKKWMQENGPAGGQLSWAPEFADIASSGDLGYTTGPWEFRRTAQDPPGGFGHYVTLWRKQANGEWKAELDNGIAHAQTPRPARVDSPQIAKDVAAAKPKAELDQAHSALAAADKTAAANLTSLLADDVRLYRDGAMPFVGKSAAQKRLSEAPGTLTAIQSDVKISNAADLGYSYGMAEFKSADGAKPIEYSNYLRIWKKQRDGSWKIVLDLLNPAPKP